MIPNVLAETRVQALPGFGLPPAFSRRIVMFLTAIIPFLPDQFCLDTAEQRVYR